MPGKPPDKETNLNPGAGSYDVKKFDIGTHTSVKIGTGPKVGQDLSSRKIVPGPGNYSLVPKRSNEGGTIGKDDRFRDKPN